MRVLVCGGRRFSDTWFIFNTLDSLHLQHRFSLVIEGNAQGVDRTAGDWAYKTGLLNHTFPADWKKHGRGAGPIRNQQMLDEGKPNMVVAFPGGKGTADMLRRATAASVIVHRVFYSTKGPV